MSKNPEQNPTQRISDDQLPPLEPTAEVPAVNSDTLNNPAYWNSKLSGKTAVVPREHRDDKHEKKGLGWKKPAAVVALLGAVGTFGFVGKSLISNDSSPSNESNRTVSGPANPGEKSEQIAEKKFGISATEFQNNPEKLAAEYYSQLNSFRIAGATQEAATSDEYFQTGVDKYVEEMSIPIDESFLGSLFIDGWETNPELAEMVTAELAIASRTRELRMMSWGGGTDAKEPYARELIIESTGVTMDPITTNTLYSERDNASMTSVFDNLDGQDVNTMSGGETITWVNVDGKLKISNISYFAG